MTILTDRLWLLGRWPRVAALLALGLVIALGMAPLDWWKRYGYTGYTWGEPSQRIFETYAYLNKIYKTQRPKVVFLEVGNLYRDSTNVQVLDSIVRTFLGQICQHPINNYKFKIIN